MTRRRKDPFAGKENVRHFRLVHRPLGAETVNDDQKTLSFDDLFEEYDPSGMKHFRGQEILETEEFYEEVDGDGSEYDFQNDEDGELVDIDAELDQFAENFIDIEGEGDFERIKFAKSEEKVGEAAKFGILLDDRDYDYTKHLRRVGITPGAVFIKAPGIKKVETGLNEKKPRDFFATEETPVVIEEEEESFDVPSDETIKANHENARQQFRNLLQQVGDDPMLREVIEALEDERYVTGDIDDELVISLDNMNLNEEEDGDMDQFFGNEEVDILGDDEEFPEFIPSEALKKQMERIAAQEAQYEQNEQEQDEFDQILNEYEDDDVNESYEFNDEYVDIEGDFDFDDNIKKESLDEEAEEIYKYLREHGRSRGTTLYDKKRPDHLPPIHIAIAQYNELRRELSVNNEQIIKKYAVEDEEETRRQLAESEKIIEEMVKIIDDPKEMEKRLNIETAKYLLKLSENAQNVKHNSGPKKIIERTSKQTEAIPTPTVSENDESESESDFENEQPRINKGIARSANETAEEKKARKAKIKAEKREKRTEKKNRK